MILGISLLVIALVVYIQSLPSLRCKVSGLLSRSQLARTTTTPTPSTTAQSFSKNNGEKKDIVDIVGDGSGVANVESRSVVKQPQTPITFTLNTPSDENEEEDTHSDSDTASTSAFSPPVLSPPTLTLAAPATPEGSPIFAPTAVKDRIQVPYLSLNAGKLGSRHIINKPPTPPGDDDEDYIPSFPAIGSAQRAASSIPALKPQNNAASLMLPPPLPNRFQGQPNSRKPVRNMAANGLMDSLRAQRGGGLQTPPTITEKPKKPRKKVILEPGHSPLDWARLQRSGYDLRGISTPGFLRITPSELKKHNNQPDDVWTALNGKVYNLSAYLPFHPGGEKEALRGAGKDCTTLFMKVHPWVNAEGMLKECLIGFLVPEDDEGATNDIQTDDKPVVINGSLEDVD